MRLRTAKKIMYSHANLRHNQRSRMRALMRVLQNAVRKHGWSFGFELLSLGVVSDWEEEKIKTQVRVASVKDPKVTCWCGATGNYTDLFADDFDDTCGGSGTLHCYCGGDQCVCHNHGEIECPGCEDCDETTDDDWADCYLDDDLEDAETLDNKS